MSAPSVPRCGRLDEHAPHVWMRIAIPADCRVYHCPGDVVHEGGARCADCGSVVCRCDVDLSDARRDEWWAE